MDKNLVKSVIEGLKSTSSTKVQESLLKIRSKITVNDEGIKIFREAGGLECLLPHLRKPNERILDITLSILGNCCLEEESSLVVGKLNTFGPLINVLKTVCRDSIVGRACRFMGNLAQRNANAESLHNHGAVSALVTFIENRDRNTSYPTLTMAVRAVRQLWMLTDKREEMLSLNAVRCIAVLLTAECESAGIIKPSSASKESDGLRKSQEELISGILKCLGYFTTHATVQCAEQIQGDGRGYQCLVALTKTFESLTLKCLMNLCYLSSSRPLLGTAGFVESLVGILEKAPEVWWWPEGAARALAQLSGEAVNRSRLRHARGLPLLLAAARRDQHAMHALLQYVFDDSSFQILVSEGLISLLTDELTEYLTTMDYEHTNLDAEMISEASPSSSTEKTKDDTTSETTNVTSKGNLFTRRRQNQMSTKNEDELKVVIERDNIIVGFVDAVDSDASDDSQSDDDSVLPPRRKGLKRPRSTSPMTLKKKSQLIKMASKDWSAGVYWEPKSPEWPPAAPGHSRSPDGMDRSPMSPYSDGNQSGFSPSGSGFGCKRARWEWSPESGVSSGSGGAASPHWTEYQWSPASSPHSEASPHHASSDSEMSGRYSPVCSESECDRDCDPGGGAGREAGCEGEEGGVVASCSSGMDAAQVANHLDDLIMEDDDSTDADTHFEDPNKLQSNSKTSRIACVLVLLFRVSHGACNTYGATRDEPVSNHTLELLTGRECLNALLDYVERCKRPLGRAGRILARVLSNALCLMSILKHRLALRLHSMSVASKHPPAKCQQCKQIMKLSTKLLAQLTILAESSYGIGEISYQLLKGTTAMKQTLCLTLPYIVRNERPLRKYFIDCNALNQLLTIVSESLEEMQDCVLALSKLATNVHIKDPKTLENRFKDQLQVNYDPILDNLTAEEIVTFELDDQSTVMANKTFLCQNSEVFSAMLKGCFKESAERCVRLKNVTKPALEYLLTLLHLGLNNNTSDVQVFPLADKLDTNLEVILLADRFLFDKVKELLSSAILQFQLTAECADKIYAWSLSEGMGFLCVESVAYLLTGKMTNEERTRSFRTILNMEYKEQWLDDIRSMIMRHLMSNGRLETKNLGDNNLIYI